MGDFTGNSIRFLASRQITKHAAVKHNLLSGGGELLTHSQFLTLLVQIKSKERSKCQRLTVHLASFLLHSNICMYLLLFYALFHVIEFWINFYYSYFWVGIHTLLTHDRTKILRTWSSAAIMKKCLCLGWNGMGWGKGKNPFSNFFKNVHK